MTDAEDFAPRDADQLAYVTQTTLSVHDTAAIVEVLKARFPDIVGPAQGRHLLRHHQPAGSGQARGAHRRRHDRGRRAELVEFAAAQGSGRARPAARTPRWCSAPPTSTGTNSARIARLGITAGASAPEVLVEEIIGAFAAALRGERGNRLRRRGGRVLPAAPPAAGEPGGGVSLMAVYTDVTADDLTEFLSRLRHRRVALLQGHRRGRGEFEFPAAHRRRQFHPHAVREARAAPKTCRSSSALMEHLAARGITCPQPVKNKQGGMLGKHRRPAGGDRHFPRRRVDPPPPPRPLRGGGRGARRACIWPARIFPCSGRTRSACEAGAGFTSMPRRAATACGPACATRSPRNSTRWRNPGRAICPRA